jgi:hypothetical protein
MSSALQQSLENWRAHHFFYHADRNQLVREVVAPLMQQLYSSGLIDRFFFVQYDLGGPHVRLRWRLTCKAHEPEADAIFAEEALKFIARCASRAPLPEEKIRINNRSLLGLDPAVNLNDDQVYPDNSYRSFPIEFEIERYGGIFKFRDSLDFFTLSSIHIFKLLSRPNESDSWRRSAMLNLAMRLAWGFSAGDPDMFVDLAGYGVKLMGDRFGPCVDYGDQIFTRRASELVPALKNKIDCLVAFPNSHEADWLTGASCQFAVHFSELQKPHFREIAASHMHMTANRLGISNADEVYLSRLLWRAVNAIRAEMPADWERWWNTYPGSDWCFLPGSFEATVTSVLSDFATAKINTSKLVSAAMDKQ